MRSTILVVDDHPSPASRSPGCCATRASNAVCAANGVEALDALSTAARPRGGPHPARPGHAQDERGRVPPKALRSDPRCASVPVIALTGSLDPHQLDRLQGLGVAEVIAKARFTVDELLAHVRAHADRGRTDRLQPPPRAGDCARGALCRCGLLELPQRRPEPPVGVLERLHQQRRRTRRARRRAPPPSPTRAGPSAAATARPRTARAPRRRRRRRRSSPAASTARRGGPTSRTRRTSAPARRRTPPPRSAVPRPVGRPSRRYAPTPQSRKIP